MKINHWKKYLSYLFEIPIESKEGREGISLNVSLVKGRYQLYTDKAIYSFSDLYYNFDSAFRHLDVKNQKINSVLLLGVGLGSIPYILEQKYGLNYEYTGVEWDENVLYLAEKYSLHELNSPTTMIAADAHLYMDQNTNKYDLICMDIFVDDITPDIFHQKEFLKNLKSALTSNGIILFNCLYRNEADKILTDAFYVDQFMNYFKSTDQHIIKGNCILIGRN